jgi:hypothetical protein
MKTAQWLTLSLAATLLTVTACSNTSNPGTSASQDQAKPVETAQAPASSESSRPVTDVTIAPGTDPMAMVFALRQPKEAAIGSEQIRVAYPSPDKAVVTVTRTGLQDDSVTALRTRYEFSAPDATVEGTKQWSLTQVTAQNKCQRDRGPQDWSGELCQ